MSVRNSIAVVLVSFVALSSPSCVLSDGMDLEDSAWKDTASEELSNEGALVVEGDTEGVPEDQGAHVLGGERVPYSGTNRFCIYALNPDSSISAYGCFPSKPEADAYRNTFIDWRVIAGFDNRNPDGTVGNVRFLALMDFDCSPTQKYEVPSFLAPEYGAMDNTFISAIGNNASQCDRIRVFDLPNFGGTAMPCLPLNWCLTLDVPPKYLNMRVSSFRVLDE